MEFRDLKKQYSINQKEINEAIQQVLLDSNFISGFQVQELEQKLAQYVGVKHCITCGNGTDALQLALMAWNIGEKDAVFVPDFTFFSSGEVVPTVGATPVFVDVDKNTYNLDVQSLEQAIQYTLEHTDLTPKAIIAVDLFGQPADYPEITKLANKYGLLVLEDAAQGFGGTIAQQKACSFGDITTTSFFPAKPLGCYGDGGAVFTNNDEWTEKIKSLRIHGKGNDKYDNIRIGMNSRLDTLQAAVLLAKLPVFDTRELPAVNQIAQMYSDKLQDMVTIPMIKSNMMSSWAQYTIQLQSEKLRNKVAEYLKDKGIPTAVYYKKPMHQQKAFNNLLFDDAYYPATNDLCQTVLSLPMHPYLQVEEIDNICKQIQCAINEG